MEATHTDRNAKLYGYICETNENTYSADVPLLYNVAAKDNAKKLLVIGGLHRYFQTGEPTGQNIHEKVTTFNVFPTNSALL